VKVKSTRWAMVFDRSGSWSLRSVVIGAVIGLVAVLALIGFVGRSLGDGGLRDELAAEFAGAYPVEPAGGGKRVEINLVASPSSIEITGGVETNVWSYNGSVPGPALTAELGDTLQITVRNDLPAATTIHWHGVRVPNGMDGVPDVNQPRIAPGEEFVYEYTPPDAGTFWYHSHTDGSEQLERGLYGSLVITEPVDADTDSSAAYDHDVVWMIDDWLLGEDGQIDPEFDTAEDRSSNGRWGNVITVNSGIDETLEVQPGQRIRLRLINASNGRVYAPDLGDLSAKLISVDGLTVGRVDSAEGLVLAPGNRADLDITVPDEVGTYAIIDGYDSVPHALGSIVVAGEPVEVVAFEPAINLGVPDWSSAIEAPVDHELLFETFVQNEDEWIWTINGAAFPDGEPLQLTKGEFTKIKLVNQTHPLHPMHFHGQFFKVLSRNGEPVDEPFFRDTILLEGSDVVEVGMVPLDAGEWILHCHIQEHAEAGMITIMDVS